MSAKPRFEPRFGWAVRTPQDGGFFATESSDGAVGEIRVRVVDARDLTAEKAVEKVFANMADLYAVTTEGLNRFLVGTGMTARVVNGKVKVRRVKA